MPVVWDFSKLRHPDVASTRCARAVDLAELIAFHPVTSSALDVVLRSTKEEIKTLSHNGAVRRHGRHHDDGNWRYSVLWCAMGWLRPPPHQLILLWLRFPSLHPHPAQGCSAKSVEFMGDMIEVMLAMTYETGPAVPDRINRIQLNGLVREFNDNLDAIDHIVVAVCDGPPLVRERPPPHEFCFLLCFVTCPSRTSEWNHRLVQVSMSVRHVPLLWQK